MTQVFLETASFFEEALKDYDNEAKIFQASKCLQEFLDKQAMEGGISESETCRRLAKNLFSFLSRLETEWSRVHKTLFRALSDLLDFCGVSLIGELLVDVSESLKLVISSSKIFLVENDKDLEFLRRKIFSYCSKVSLYCLVASKGSREQQQELLKELTTGKAIHRIDKPLRKSFLPQFQLKYSSKSDSRLVKESSCSTKGFQVFELQRLAVTETARSIYRIFSKLHSHEKLTIENIFSFLNLTLSDYCDQPVLFNICECLLRDANGLKLEVSLPTYVISYSSNTETAVEYLSRFILRAIKKSRVSCNEYHQKWLRLYANCMFERNKDSLMNVIKGNELSSGEILNQLIYGKCSIQLPSIVDEIETLEDVEKLNIYIGHFCRLICNYLSSNKVDLAVLHHLLLLGFVKVDGIQKRTTSKKNFYAQLHSQLCCFEQFLRTWQEDFLQSLRQQSCLAIFHDIARLDSKIFDVEGHSLLIMDRLALLIGSCASIVRLLEIDANNKALSELRAQITQKCLVFRSANLRYSSCNYLAACGSLDSGLRESLITELLQLLKISDLELYSPSHKRLSSLEFRQLYGSLLSRILGYSAGITCLLLEERDELGLPGGLLGQIFSDAVGLLRPHILSKVSLPQTAESIRRRAGWVLVASLMKTRVARFLESSHLTRLLQFWQAELSFLRNNVEISKSRQHATSSQVEFSAQEASLAAARLASLGTLYHLLEAIEPRGRPPNFDSIVSVLISACAVRVAEVWQTLQRDENSTKSVSNMQRLFSLCEVFWLSRCALYLDHNQLSVDTCLRVSLAIVHSHGKKVTPEIIQDLEGYNDYFQLISFFGSLGAELPSQIAQLQTAVDCSATLLTAEQGKHPVWIELSFPISTKDYILSPLIGSKFGYKYASEFRIQKRALDGWCLSRLQASLWVALDVALFQRLEKQHISPWHFCLEQEEMSSTLFYMSNAFVELGKKGDTQLRHDLITNLCRLSQEKANESGTIPSLYAVWRQCICVMSLSLLCSDENIPIDDSDKILVKNAIYNVLDTSDMGSWLAGVFAAMEAASLFVDEPNKFLIKVYSAWKCGKEDFSFSHIRVAVYRWMDLLSASFWHAYHFVEGDCLLSICTLKILNECIRNWFPTWLKENDREMLEICETILWNCARWNCSILNCLILDICSFIWNWMETDASLDTSDRNLIRSVIPFNTETLIVTNIMTLLAALCRETQAGYGFILKHVVRTLSLICEIMGTSHLLQLIPSLPQLLIEIMDLYDDYAVETNALLKKLALGGRCDLWFTIFFRSFRGGSKKMISLEVTERSSENDTRFENTLESGLVSDIDEMEFWQLKGRTRDLLMESACCVLKEGSVTLNFFLTNSMQLILASCQSLRMNSIIEAFQLVRVMREKLAIGNESPSQGALLQLFSSIRSILNPQHHPMIVVAAAQAAVEISLWNPFADDELVDLIVPQERRNQLPNYWQYERWSEPVGVVTLFAMLRFASEWYYYQSVSNLPKLSVSSHTDLRPYVLAVIGDFSFILSGHSWMFEKWGCSIGSDGVYRDKLSEVFWKHGTSFIHNMILVEKLNLMEDNGETQVIWKQPSSPGVQLAERIQDLEEKEELVLSIHLAWLRHLMVECPASQETQQLINCFESNLMLAFLYNKGEHSFLNIIWRYLVEMSPKIVLNMVHSVIKSIYDESILVRIESRIVESFCWLSAACRTGLFDDTESVSGLQSYLRFMILISPIQLADEKKISKFNRLRDCILQMFLMGTCGYFHCLSCHLLSNSIAVDNSSDEDIWLAQADEDQLSDFWKQGFQLVSKYVDTTIANHSFQYCMEQLLSLRPISSRLKVQIMEKLVALLYCMVEYLPLETSLVQSAFSQICLGLDDSNIVSYNWLALVVLPGIQLFPPELLAFLWRVGWTYWHSDSVFVGTEDSRELRIAWMRIYIHLMTRSETISRQTSTSRHKNYLDALIIQIAIDMILTREENDNKIYSLTSDLLQLAKKNERVFRRIIHSLQLEDRLALQKVLKHATK
ncbi:hypothetical protein GpartN1_g1089.t1 [Galdieria partita]|uniref:Uncharacterized protein n=1 Tax=Galdieria partita TaxID=83374 RepID=A0A9C7PRG6_9RHOD|nr:hypothetical protein GpartN1_g1089.t1 [Galdieria partita]